MSRPTTPSVGTQLTIFPEAEGDVNLRSRYEELLRNSRVSVKHAQEALDALRELILLEGLPKETLNETKLLVSDVQNTTNTDSIVPRYIGCSLRGRVWKCMLRLKTVHTESYIELAQLGPSDSYETILIDVTQAFTVNTEFNTRIPIHKMKRLLNSFVWKHSKDENIKLINGITSIVAPILYTMGEVEGFYSFDRLITKVVPLYFHPEGNGIQSACSLLGQVLEEIDPQIYNILMKDNLNNNIDLSPRNWAIECMCHKNRFNISNSYLIDISSLMTCQQPFSEVIKLWDFFMGYGFQFCLLCIASQIILHREEIVTIT
jgi:hypothetical protein